MDDRRFEISAATAVGAGVQNETGIVIDVERGLLLVVDGNSWDSDGTTAGRAADAFLDAIERGEAVGSALRTAGRAIEGAAATAIAAVLHADSVTIASAGDCRAYLLTAGSARLIVREQTLGEQLVARGQLTAEQELTFPHRNVVLNALGVGGDPEISVVELSLAADDALLLCTKGVHRSLDDLGAAVDGLSALVDVGAAILCRRR